MTNYKRTTGHEKKYVLTAGVLFLLMAVSWPIDSFFGLIFLGAGVYFSFLSLRHQTPQENRTSRKSKAKDVSFEELLNQFNAGSASQPSSKLKKTNANWVAFVAIFVVLGLILSGIATVVFMDDGMEEMQQSLEQDEYYNDYTSAQEAYNSYTQALKKDSRDVNALVGLGEVYRELNEPDSALMMFDRALQIDGNTAAASLNKAQIYFSREQYAEVVSILTPVVSRNPTDYAATQLLGDAYYTQVRYDEAMVWYERVYEEPTMRNRWLCHIMAYILDTKGNLAQAIPLYEETLRYDSSVVEVYDRLSELVAGEKRTWYKNKADQLRL